MKCLIMFLQITNYESLQLDHQAQCQQYEQDVHTSEEKYLDSLEECKRLEVKLSETKRFVFNYF